jgi:hypothetical protein
VTAVVITVIVLTGKLAVLWLLLVLLLVVVA